MHSDMGSGMVLTRSYLFTSFLLQRTGLINIGNLRPFSIVYADEIGLGSGLKRVRVSRSAPHTLTQIFG